MKYSMRRWHILAGIVIVFVPLVPLFFYDYFYIDWMNNLWVIRYYTRFFEQYHSFPLTLNSTNKGVSMVNPLFYGYLYYQIMALLDLILGGTKRAILFSMILVQSAAYEMMTRMLTCIFRRFADKTFWLIRGTILMAFWTPYLISTIYDQGVRTEYMAVFFLFIMGASWIYALYQENFKKQVVLWTLAALNLMLLCGTHPVTTEIGGVLFGILVLVTLPMILKKTRHKAVVLGLGGLLLIMVVGAVSPWLYICITSGVDLKINADSRVFVGSSGLNEVINRLIPFPYNYGAVHDGIYSGHPVMDYQVNIPLLIMNVLSFVLLTKAGKGHIKQKAVSCVIFVFGLFMFICSSVDAVSGITGTLFYSVQYATRLITYVDIAVFIGVCYNIYVLYTIDDKKYKRWIYIMLLISVTLCMHNMSIMWGQAFYIADYEKDDISSVHAPDNFYWNDDYAAQSTQYIARKTAGNIQLEELPLKTDGLTTDSVEFENTTPTWIETNISGSPFNHVYLDGVEISKSELYRFDWEYKYVFQLKEPGHHVLSCRFEVPSVYYKLRTISYVCILLMAVMLFGSICIYVAGKRDRLKRKAL